MYYIHKTQQNVTVLCFVYIVTIKSVVFVMLKESCFSFSHLVIIFVASGILGTMSRFNS